MGLAVLFATPAETLEAPGAACQAAAAASVSNDDVLNALGLEHAFLPAVFGSSAWEALASAEVVATEEDPEAAEAQAKPRPAAPEPEAPAAALTDDDVLSALGLESAPMAAAVGASAWEAPASPEPVSPVAVEAAAAPVSPAQVTKPATPTLWDTDGIDNLGLAMLFITPAEAHKARGAACQAAHAATWARRPAAVGPIKKPKAVTLSLWDMDGVDVLGLPMLFAMPAEAHKVRGAACQAAHASFWACRPATVAGGGAPAQPALVALGKASTTTTPRSGVTPISVLVGPNFGGAPHGSAASTALSTPVYHASS